MNKIKYLILAVLVALNVQLWASDNFSSGAGVSRQVQITRWTTTKVGPSSSTVGVTATTNVLQSVSGVVGKIIVVPGAVTDILEIHNSATVAGVSASTDIFKYTATSATLGMPVIFDLLPGISGTSGITVVNKIAASSTTMTSYINSDKAQ